ncbi:MAG: diacylglycerol kinase family lipid kinase [Saprospiraceae bacterium]|nr:diacylglycerol kinase family lipid kinase [Saprospiraceae bacterium]
MEKSHPIAPQGIWTEALKPRRILFIVNPKAGRPWRRHLDRSVDQYLNHRKFEYGIRVTEAPGHGTELARQAVAEGYEVVVAVGGDGTVNEVAEGLLNSNTPLGIVPAGSGNGLAMHLGIGRDMDRAVQRLNTATLRHIDACRINERLFVNLTGVGFDGLVAHLSRRNYTRGLLPYFLRAVQAGLTHPMIDFAVEADGRRFPLRALSVAVCNGPMYGYGVEIAPGARLDDGLLDVVALRAAPRYRYFAAVPAFLRGKVYDLDFIEHFRAANITLSAPGTHYINLDGEGITMDGPLTFRVENRPITLLV